MPPAPALQYTRCPACRTLFRVTADQLERRAGQVRCGQCKAVFDGSAHVVFTESEPPREATTTRDVAATAPVPVVSATPIGETSGEARKGASVANGAAKASRAQAGPARRSADARRSQSKRAMDVFHALAIALLVLLLGAQALFHFSSAIAAHWPRAAPVLALICETAGCAIRPLPDPSMQHLAIEASDLQADPAHKGLLILTATIRNRAGWTLAFPHLELTLTDAQDQVVVRRALAPSEYAGGTVDVAQGIAANGEAGVKLFIDASATAQSGYRLYLFYP